MEKTRDGKREGGREREREREREGGREGKMRTLYCWGEGQGEQWRRSLVLAVARLEGYEELNVILNAKGVEALGGRVPPVNDVRLSTNLFRRRQHVGALPTHACAEGKGSTAQHGTGCIYSDDGEGGILGKCVCMECSGVPRVPE